MRVLLVTPRFRNYWRSYASALEDLGHTVEVFLYDNFQTTGAILTNKLVYEVPGRFGSTVGQRALSRRVTRDVIAFLDTVKVDVALVIKGDVFEHAFWDTLDRLGVPSVLYLYDDLIRMEHTTETLRRARHVATYSLRDQREMEASGYSVTYVPLFFDPKLRFNPVREDVIVFVGARYAQREGLLMGLHAAGVPVVAYGRDWSHRLVDRFRSLELRRPDVPGRPDVSLAESYGLAAGAAAAINMHGGHDGFNNRTFEICGAGGLQLIDRPDVQSFYEIGTEVLAYQSPEQLHDHALRTIADRAWARRMRDAARRRSHAQHTCLHRVRELAQCW